jgi:hypothetical protein
LIGVCSGVHFLSNRPVALTVGHCHRSVHPTSIKLVDISAISSGAGTVQEPSWTVLASPDKAAGTDVVRSMAERAGATITEVEGSHVIMISRPDAVADVIKTAAGAVSRQVAAMAG